MSDTLTPSTPEVKLSDRPWGVLAHLSLFLWLFNWVGFLAFVVPLVMAFVFRSSFVRNHAYAVLDLQLSFLVYGVVGFVVIVATAGFGALVVESLMIVGIIGSLVFAVVGANRAGRGMSHTYPLTLKIFRRFFGK